MTKVFPSRPSGVLPLRYKNNDANHAFFVNIHNDDIPHQGSHLLSNPRSVSLPSKFKLKDREYTVSEFIAQGSDGAIYSGSYQDGDEIQVIFKVYSGGALYKNKGYPSKQYFQNEKNALLKLGRLIDADEKDLILIIPKISGTSLSELLRRIRANMKNDDEGTQRLLKDLMKKYLELPAEFRQKWGMAHMDIHPVNVMVDDDGEMHLIDFSKTVELNGDEEETRLMSNMDDIYAKIAGTMHFSIPPEEFGLN